MVYSVESQIGNAWDNSDPFALVTSAPSITWPIFARKANLGYPVSFVVYPPKSGPSPTYAYLNYAIAGGAGCPGSFQFSIVGWQSVSSTGK